MSGRDLRPGERYFSVLLEEGGKFVRRRYAIWNARVSDLAFGAHDALAHRRLAHQERARDLAGRQASERAQGERDACLGGQHRVACGEYQPQQVVADVVFACGIERIDEIGHEMRLERIEIEAEFFAL